MFASPEEKVVGIRSGHLVFDASSFLVAARFHLEKSEGLEFVGIFVASL